MPSLTIVIPCYNEQDRFPIFFQQLCKDLEGVNDIQIFIIDDGSELVNYNTMVDKIQKIPSQLNYKLIRYEKNKGKGFAISKGIEEANTDYVGFVDADGAVPGYEILNLWNYLKNNPNVDYVSGARIIMLGKKVYKSFPRHISSRIFATYFTLIYGIKMYDPQCGLKLFKKSAYLQVFSSIQDFRWLWDTQLTVLLHKKKYNLEEIPIDWKEVRGSKVSILKDSISMFFKLLHYRKIGE